MIIDHLAGHDKCRSSSNAKYDENDRATNVPEIPGAARTTGWLMVIRRIIKKLIFIMLWTASQQWRKEVMKQAIFMIFFRQATTSLCLEVQLLASQGLVEDPGECQYYLSILVITCQYYALVNDVYNGQFCAMKNVFGLPFHWASLYQVQRDSPRGWTKYDKGAIIISFPFYHWQQKWRQ